MRTKATLMFVLTMISLAVCQDFDIVVNKANALSEIPAATLKRIYTGLLDEIDGKKVVPINQDMAAALTTAFLAQIVKKTAADYQTFCIEQQIKGAGTAPMIQKTNEMVLAIVSQIPGAIGYVQKGKATDAVKVITIK